MTEPLQATPLTLDQADTLRRGLPFDTPARLRDQAELVELRDVATHLLQEHAQIAAPFPCYCATCRRASSWVPRPHHAQPAPHVLSHHRSR